MWRSAGRILRGSRLGRRKTTFEPTPHIATNVIELICRGKTAHRVRREGTALAVSYPYSPNWLCLLEHLPMQVPFCVLSPQRIKRKTSMSRFKRASHVIWHCQYHIVWVPKYRFRVLQGPVGKRSTNV
jgi:hypothetical protein